MCLKVGTVKRCTTEVKEVDSIYSDNFNVPPFGTARRVLHVLKNLGHFDLLLVSGIFFSCVRELVPSSVSVRKSVRTSHWNNQASPRLRFMRDLRRYFLLPCTHLFMLEMSQSFSASCTKLLHYVQLSCTFGTLVVPIMFVGPDF
jgi:hypothetical protein